MYRKVVFSVLFAVFFVVSIAESAMVLDKIVAIVNKDVITWGELYKAMEFESGQEMKSMKEEDKQKFFKDNELPFLEVMIDMRLEVQEAAKIGIAANEEEVNKAIESMKKKYSMTQEVFAQTLMKEGFSMAEYRKKLSEQIMINRLVDQEVRSKIVIGEADIDRYLLQHPVLTKDEEAYAVSLIFLKTGDDKKKVEEQAAAIFEKLKAGGDFSEIARQYSEDSNAKNGGDLGFIKKSEISKELLTVLSTMKAGDISQPFWSDKGMEILKLNEMRAYKTPQEVREAVRQKLYEEKFNVDIKSWVKGLRERSYVEIKA
ncbi:MAG: peptidylprolyl isomerase [Dissulfurispiraceae bacterium]